MSRPNDGHPEGLSSLDILVVDDEDDVRRGLKRLLEGLGVRISEARDGLHALEVLRRRPADIIVTDVRMPRLDGVELLETVRRESPDTQVLLLSGFGTIDLAVACMQAGAAHFMAKPFDNHELLRTVRGIAGSVLSRKRVDSSGTIVAGDPCMKALLDQVHNVAATRLPVLVEGETGTGKELIARLIHDSSPVRDATYLAVNCAALPDTLLESELFGHCKGSFTGADRDHVGIFEQAQGGTVFLDEIASMSAAFQGKLLRVIEDKVVRPLGGRKDIAVDFRLVAATNRDLDTCVSEGSFRNDLLYRLRVLHVKVPPLRDRTGDILPLARMFVGRLTPECLADDALPPQISAAAVEVLKGHRWPGNVRELEAAVMRALVNCHGDELQPHHFDVCWEHETPATYEEGKKAAIARFQRRFIEKALEATGGNVSQSAEACGMTRAAMQKIMRALSIDRRDFTAS